MSDSDKTPETLEDALARIEVLTSQLSTVRGEAAKARVDKRDAVANAKNEAQAEFEEKMAELRKQGEETGVELNKSKIVVTKLTAALNAVAPDIKDRVVDIAGRLVGSSDEELAKDADRVKALFGLDQKPRTPATDPSQGSGNNTELPLNGDPLLNAMMGVLNKKHR